MKKIIQGALVVMLLFAVLPGVALAQDGGPVVGVTGPIGEEEESPWAPFKPIGEFLTKVFVTVFGLAIFVFGTVKGTDLLKVFLPKLKDKPKWEEIRRQILVVLSNVIAISIVFGADVNLFGLYESMAETFAIDPFFAKLLSGLVIGLGSNEGYNRFIDK